MSEFKQNIENNNIILEAKSLNKFFYDPVKIEVLKDITFDLKSEDFLLPLETKKLKVLWRNQ